MSTAEEYERIRAILQRLVELASAVEKEAPAAIGQRLWKCDSYKSLKAQLHVVDRAVNSVRGVSKSTAECQAWLAPAVTEAIGHLGGESGITRRLWALEEALDGVTAEIAKRHL